MGGKRAGPRYSRVSHTHDVGVIRQIDNFVSINSAVEVDLFGQVSADMLGGQQWTGPGGAVDMMRGAALCRKAGAQSWRSRRQQLGVRNHELSRRWIVALLRPLAAQTSTLLLRNMAHDMFGTCRQQQELRL